MVQSVLLQQQPVTVKPPFPAKYRVMKMPSEEFEYSWLDKNTILVLTRSSNGNLQFTTMPGRAKYFKLCKALHEDIQTAIYIPRLLNAGKDLVAVTSGRHYSVFHYDGNLGPQMGNYHADVCWQRDHIRAIHSFIGTNGHLLSYGLVSLYTFSTNLSPEITPIQNSASNPLFVSGMVIDCALSKQYISVLSRPINTKDLYGDDESKNRKVWLLNRQLGNLDGPTKRMVLNVPYNVYEGAKFSPDGNRFYLWSTPKGSDYGKMYIGKTSDGSLKQLKLIPRRLRDETLRNIKWKPDSKSISITWDGYLYVLPVE